MYVVQVVHYLVCVCAYSVCLCMDVLYNDAVCGSLSLSFELYQCSVQMPTHLPVESVQYTTINSPNCGHFGTQASVLYSESVLYLSVRVISSPFHVAITVIILF